MLNIYHLISAALPFLIKLSQGDPLVAERTREEMY